MFISKIPKYRQRPDGTIEKYDYWRLSENWRDAEGKIRKRTVVNLGELPGYTKAGRKELGTLLEEMITTGSSRMSEDAGIYDDAVKFYAHWHDLHPQSSSPEAVPDSSLAQALESHRRDIVTISLSKVTNHEPRVIGKNGKPKERNGSSPIRESVVNIKPDTTMSDLLKYTEKVRQRWGVRAIQTHIHKDEGHYTNPDDPSTWQPNLHAHIIWDWMNHDTGKSYKLGKKDMEELQDLAAETLEMERGKRKSETGAEHLERNDFILQKQKEQSAELNTEIAEKRDRMCLTPHSPF